MDLVKNSVISRQMVSKGDVIDFLHVSVYDVSLDWILLRRG